MKLIIVTSMLMLAGCASINHQDSHSKTAFCDSVKEYVLKPSKQDTAESAKALDGLNKRIRLYCGTQG